MPDRIECTVHHPLSTRVACAPISDGCRPSTVQPRQRARQGCRHACSARAARCAEAAVWLGHVARHGLVVPQSARAVAHHQVGRAQDGQPDVWLRALRQQRLRGSLHPSARFLNLAKSGRTAERGAALDEASKPNARADGGTAPPHTNERRRKGRAVVKSTAGSSRHASADAPLAC